MKRAPTRKPREKTGKSKEKLSGALKRAALSQGKKTSGFFDWRGVALRPEDRNFEKCPDDQWGICLQYERRRELVFYRRRTANRKRTKTTPNPRVLFLDELPWFPDTPWLLIPENKRNELTELYRKHSPDVDALSVQVETYPLFLKSLKDCNGNLCSGVTRQSGGQAVSTVVISIGWSFNDTCLKKAFGMLVDRLRKELRRAKVKGIEPCRSVGKRGRPPSELLRYIGLRRTVLANGVKTIEGLNRLASGFSYGDTPAMWRAVGKARRWLETSPELHWPEV